MNAPRMQLNRLRSQSAMPLAILRLSQAAGHRVAEPMALLCDVGAMTRANVWLRSKWWTAGRALRALFGSRGGRPPVGL